MKVTVVRLGEKRNRACTEALFGSTCVTKWCVTLLHRGHRTSPLQRQPFSELCMSCLNTSWTHDLMTSETLCLMTSWTLAASW
jgi:hypothetical protein